MKALPKRKGNASQNVMSWRSATSLNESPSEKEGKSPRTAAAWDGRPVGLNESPSEKEGKFVTRTFNQQMMVLPQ